MYHPLLSEGFHLLTLEQIEQICVLAIGTKRRKDLFQRLKILLDEFRKFNISLEYWINGSFVTSKPNPGDIDIVVFADAVEVCNLSQQVKTALRILQDPHDIRARYNCDVYFIAGAGIADIEYWTKTFSGKKKGPLKGIIKLKL